MGKAKRSAAGLTADGRQAAEVGLGGRGLPCPTAQEPEDYLRRLQTLYGAYQRQRGQREGFGRDVGMGRGQEFVGYRPYRAGEDARDVDFLVLARLGRPFVRVLRAEAHRVVTLVLDRSASMAVGPPGKWQSAVEVYLALAHLWVKLGAQVRCFWGAGAEQQDSLVLNRPGDWNACRRLLFEQRAGEGPGLRELLPQIRSGGSHVVLVGDLFDLQPAHLGRHLMDSGLRGNGSWSLIRLLAEQEVHPPVDVPVHWMDPEGAVPGVSSSGGLDRQVYLQRLANQEEEWREWCSKHGVGYVSHLAGTPFETALRGTAGGTSMGVLDS